MIFNSAVFIAFFLLFFFVYWAINNKLSIGIRNLLIVVGSYIFYGWWDWRFLGLIFISSAVDFSIGYWLGTTASSIKRKVLLACSIVVNLGILGFFKYYNFFVDSFQALFLIFDIHLNINTLEIILPVGISFYTFQTLSYTIDVYKRQLQPTKDIITFFAFVSFFPQLVAGPIERASHLLPQFKRKKSFDYALCVSGLRLVLWGFFKKIVIADNFGFLADTAFNHDFRGVGLTILAGTLFFALQIYADFSGYSDIAIGISRMMGFNLVTNFNTPYFSKSFSEFWHRWHISLSTWFRDYVYIPLGGNRRGNIRTSINLITTFLLSGLWHGANVTFLIWGGLHGLALVIEKKLKPRIHKLIYAPLVIICVVLFWLPFRAKDIGTLNYLSWSLTQAEYYSLEPLIIIIEHFSVYRFTALMGVSFFFFWTEYQMQLRDFNTWISAQRKLTRIAFYYILIISILFIGNFTVKPSFIYFQF